LVIGVEMGLEKMREEVMELVGDYFDQLIEERMDIIGQNGNDGEHYVDYGAGPVEVQHEMVMDNPTEEEKKKNLEEYYRRMREDDVYI